MTRPSRIDQVIPTIVHRDAVSSHTFEAQRVLRDLGYESEIFAQNIGPDVQHLVRPLGDLDSVGPAGHGSGRWLMYQASIGAPAADVFCSQPATKLVNYHNITPVDLIGWWEPHLQGELVLGRRQLLQLAPVTALGIAVSGYNESELVEAGFAETTVAPFLGDLSPSVEADMGVAARLAAAREPGGASWLFVGQLAPHKAQHDVMKAFAFYRQAYDPRARLHLIGRELSNRYAAALRELVKRLRIEDSASMVGSVSEAEKSAYFDDADVFVCCSEHEGFCAPLIESMYRGVPVVAYGAAAVPETVGGAAVVLPSKEPSLVAAAVDRVLTDSPLRETLVAAAHARARHFDIAASRKTFADAVSRAVEAA